MNRFAMVKTVNWLKHARNKKKNTLLIFHISEIIIVFYIVISILDNLCSCLCFVCENRAEIVNLPSIKLVV